MHSLLEFPSPFPAEPGLVRLLEPPGSDAAALAARLVAGDYGKPFVLENGGLRALHFSLGYVQSVMDIANPAALVLAYARAMMAFLLFNPRPRRIGIIGLGGGSLANFCHRHLPAAELTVVEIDADVIALRRHFGVPADDARFRVLHADGVRWLGETETRSDVLLIDAFGAEGVAETLLDSDFHANAFRHLGGRGVLVMNLAGARESFAPHVARLLEVFDERVIAMPVREDGNHILFAFRDPAFAPRWNWMRSQAHALQARTGLDFPNLAGALEAGGRQGHAWRLAR
ncbi:fused MFS/spermidine synthase [Thauera phenylacetica]|jgi:spermidine synthase